MEISARLRANLNPTVAQRRNVFAFGNSIEPEFISYIQSKYAGTDPREIRDNVQNAFAKLLSNQQKSTEVLNEL